MAQNNRYLESPFAIRNTGFEGQTPFVAENSVSGGFAFFKKSFYSEKTYKERVEQERGEESEAPYEDMETFTQV